MEFRCKIKHASERHVFVQQRLTKSLENTNVFCTVSSKVYVCTIIEGSSKTTYFQK